MNGKYRLALFSLQKQQKTKKIYIYKRRSNVRCAKKKLQNKQQEKTTKSTEYCGRVACHEHNITEMMRKRLSKQLYHFYNLELAEIREIFHNIAIFV